MSDYAKIADALRFTASAISDHKLEVLSLRTLNDGATAIEELTAQVRDKDYLIQQQADEIERLRRDVKKQQDKMIELAKARELKEMETVKTWCHQRGIAMVDWPIYQSMVACYGREPKRGKWIDTVTAGIEETVCSVCRCSGFHHLKYCPGCGAEMERADEA